MKEIILCQIVSILQLFGNEQLLCYLSSISNIIRYEYAKWIFLLHFCKIHELFIKGWGWHRLRSKMIISFLKFSNKVYLAVNETFLLFFYWTVIFQIYLPLFSGLRIIYVRVKIFVSPVESFLNFGCWQGAHICLFDHTIKIQ